MWRKISLLFALLIVTIDVAHANGRSGIDVVILIDQSGSMSGRLRGSITHPEPNDEYGHRIAIAKNIVHRLAENVEGTPLVHRVSVIEFGTHARVSFSNLELAYDPNSPGGASQKAERHLYWLEASKLDYTNTAEAIEKALIEFDKMETASGDPTREKFLLLITDGRPSLPKTSTKTLRKRVKKFTAILTNQKGSTLWVVGLNDADNYWYEYDGPQFWEPIAGDDHNGVPRARLADPTFPRVASVARYMVDEWLQVKAKEIFGNQFDCPPYLRRLIFDAHFSQPGGSLRILDPNGRVIYPTSEATTYARYVIDNPSQGYYQLRNTFGIGYKIYAEEFSPIPVFLSPITRTAEQNVKVPLVFQLMSAYNTPLDVMPSWPIDAKIRIAPPSGKVQTLTAQFENNGKKFVAPWTPTEQGKHQLSFQGKIHYPDGSQNDLFANSTYQVIETVEVRLTPPPPTTPQLPTPPPPTTPPSLWLRLEMPKPNGGSWVPWEKTITVKVALQEGEQGDNIINDLEHYLTEHDKWLSVQRIDKSGVPFDPQEIIELKRNGENDFVGDIHDFELDWTRGEGWWWWTPGQLNLRFIASSDNLSDDRSLNGVWLPMGLEEKRVNGDPTTVGAIDIILPWWVHLIAILVVGIVVFFVGLSLWKLLPILAVHFYDSGRKISLLISDYENNEQRFSVAGISARRLDSLVKVDTVDGTARAQKFSIKRTQLEPPRVEINYHWLGCSKQVLKLNCYSLEPLREAPAGNYFVRLDCKGSVEGDL